MVCGFQVILEHPARGDPAYRLTDITLNISIPQRISLCHENFDVLEGLFAFDRKENPKDPPGGVA